MEGGNWVVIGSVERGVEGVPTVDAVRDRSLW